MIALLNITPYTDALVAPSPNHEARRAPAIQGIVLHATADEGNEAGTLSWLRSPRSRVSCHLVVSRTGQATRLVGDQQRAWHAGASWWRGTSDVNSITLGIEIANRNDGEPYTDAQYRRVADIGAHYCRQGLSLDDVVSHGAIAEDRRTDPFGWDWDRFCTMVREQLRTAAEVEKQHLNTYDRRSGERLIVQSAKQQLPSITVPKHQLPSIAPPKHVPALAPPKPVPTITAPTQQAPAMPPPRQAPTIRTPKPFLCSLWLNVLTVLTAGAVIIGETLDLAFSVGFTVPEEITMWALFGVGLVNIGLRHKTICSIGRSQSVHQTHHEGAIRSHGRSPVQGKGRTAAGPR